VGVHINNKEVRRIAQELATLTGESMTTAVTIAVRERLNRIRREQRPSLADRLLAIGKDYAAHLKEPIRSAEHGGLLYEECGLMRPNERLANALRSSSPASLGL